MFESDLASSFGPDEAHLRAYSDDSLPRPEARDRRKEAMKASGGAIAIIGLLVALALSPREDAEAERPSLTSRWATRAIPSCTQL